MELSRRPIHNANGTFVLGSNVPDFSTQGTPGRCAGGMGNYQFQQQSHGMLGHPSQQQPRMYGQLEGNNMNYYGRPSQQQPRMYDQFAGNIMNRFDQQYQQMTSRDVIDAWHFTQHHPQAMSGYHAPQQHTHAIPVHHAPQQYTPAMSGHSVQTQYIQTKPVHRFQQQPQAMSRHTLQKYTQAMPGHPVQSQYIPTTTVHPFQEQPQAYNSYAGNNMNNVDQQYQKMAGRDAEYMGSSDTQQQKSQMYNHARRKISDIAEQHQGTLVEYAGGFVNHQNNQHEGMVGRDAKGTNHNQLKGQPQGMTECLSQRQDTTGNIAPTHAHGYPTVQPVYGSNGFEQGRQHAMPPNSKDYAQPPSVIYSITERGTVSGPQNPTATLTNFGVQKAQSNNKQDVEKPPQSVDLNAHVRENPKNFPLKTTTSAVTTPALPTAMPAQVPPWNMLAPAPLPAATGPAFKRLRNQQTEKMDPGRAKKKAKEAHTGQRRRGQFTPDIQPVVEPTVDLASRWVVEFAEQGYDITISNLAPADSSKDTPSIPKKNQDLSEILNFESGKLEPNQDLVMGVMRQLLENSIAHFSLDTSSNTRQNLEYYQKTPNLSYHAGNLTQFASKSQFSNPVNVITDGTEGAAGPSTTVKDKAKINPTSVILYEPIKGLFDGRSMMGNCTMYTRTIFVDANSPLRYAVGFRIENVMIDGRNAQGMLTYERSLPTGIQGEPRWSDICDVLKSQHAEWNYASLNHN
ncbi:3c068ac8-5ff7-49b7-a561-82843fb37e43-CDS [Sclerotinia trifoliorum]|uniref:3c068ac8-5ff7-49b7-a561-82843fb37e43-CDS n=1 Tax=Sclerotinia trifoliorum TaxID=28548 RepID=A0A8H2VSQ2_9HELO|nr:3c068ac8-5ff7-49b7-a561-82843fb37e43-CDS [Sclerotinia trifoliorum]